MEVGMFEAKTNPSALVEQARNGEEVIITRHGQPVAMIVPSVAPKQERVFGALAHLFPEGTDMGWLDRINDPLPDEEQGLWEGRTT